MAGAHDKRAEAKGVARSEFYKIFSGPWGELGREIAQDKADCRRQTKLAYQFDTKEGYLLWHAKMWAQYAEFVNDASEERHQIYAKAEAVCEAACARADAEYAWDRRQAKAALNKACAPIWKEFTQKRNASARHPAT
jgi:hypothetical protein